MSFANNTGFAAIDVRLDAPDGAPMVVAIAKATFVVKREGVALADDPSPIRPSDVPFDAESPTTSILFASDLSLEKVGCDVVLAGDAISNRPVERMDVAVKVGDVTAPLAVHGERAFDKRFGEVVIGRAAPFERVPIVYERAYGGASDDMLAFEPRNPAGVGVAKRVADLVGKRAPQIEHPARPHTTASDAHAPMGFGPIMTSWSPRREFAGTFDPSWKSTRMPLMPRDFDPRFHNVAHPSLRFEEGIGTRTPIHVMGMREEGLLSFEVPRLPVIFRARFDRTGHVEHPALVDTIVIEPNRSRFEIVARKAFPLGRGIDLLRSIVVDPAT